MFNTGRSRAGYSAGQAAYDHRESPDYWAPPEPEPEEEDDDDDQPRDDE